MHEPQQSSSFDQWYAVAHPRLVRSLTGRCAGDVGLAAEAVDEAMVRAYERWRRVSRMSSPDAWAYRVAANQLNRMFRRRGGERRALARTQPVAEWTEIAAPSPVWQAVASLGSREREAITLRYVMGFTEAEIAVALDVKVGTASALLSRARATLRTHLDEQASGHTHKAAR